MILQQFKLDKQVDQRLKQNDILKLLQLIGINQLTHIQYMSLKNINRNIIGISNSATGKTLAYLLSTIPFIENLGICQIIILNPTRQLALQTFNIIRKIISKSKQISEKQINRISNLRVGLFIGGLKIEEDIRNIGVGIDIVIGTVGRIQQLIKTKKLNCQKLKYLVIDEFDKMLNSQNTFKFLYGFIQLDIKMLMYSATIKYLQKAQKLRKDFIIIKSDNQKLENIQEQLQQLQNNEEKSNYLDHIKHMNIKASNFDQKYKMLLQVLELSYKKCLIFYTSRQEGNKLHAALSISHKIIYLHSSLGQIGRLAALSQIKRHKIILTSDLLARGYDQRQINLVIQWQNPFYQSEFSHRVGRGGRCGQKSLSILFGQWKPLEQKYNLEMEQFNKNVAQEWLTRKDQKIKLRKMVKMDVKYLEQWQVELGRWNNRVVNEQEVERNYNYFLQSQDGLNKRMEVNNNVLKNKIEFGQFKKKYEFANCQNCKCLLYKIQNLIQSKLSLSKIL